MKWKPSSWITTLVVGLSLGNICGEETAREKPNVVFLFIDDLGYGDVPCFGKKRTNPDPTYRRARGGRDEADDIVSY